MYTFIYFCYIYSVILYAILKDMYLFDKYQPTSVGEIIGLKNEISFLMTEYV